MESSFPNFNQKWSQIGEQVTGPDYANKDASMAYVVTDNVDEKALFDVKMSEVVVKVLRGWYITNFHQNVMVTLTSGRKVTFSDTKDYRLLAVLGWREKNLVVLANTKANKGSGTLRFTTLENPKVSHEIKLPDDYQIPEVKKLRENLQKVEKCLVKLEDDKLLRLIVEHRDNATRHHMALVANDQGSLFEDKAFVKGLIAPVLYNLRALKPDDMLNKLGLLAIFAIIVGFLFLRKS